VRFANLDGRAVLISTDDTAVDVADASAGAFPSDPQAVLQVWEEFAEWAGSVSDAHGDVVNHELLGPPVPRPGQVFAIGVNYAEHAAEAGYPPDTMPVTFTKFPTCLTGPRAVVQLPSNTVDWEVEAVAVIGRAAKDVARENAWQHVAGLTVGQDLSERTSQLIGTKPQFSLAKSYPGFGPTGPWLVTPDELPDPANLAISCSISGEIVQESRTSRMVFDIPELVARLSSVCLLMPGDLIFTGTPAGVGNARNPKRFLEPGDVLESTVEGIGTIRQEFVD
jgi:2-keto-4-pentenoate hydratase/2-oxohepta-3-ene-1,7-dioic acid hydratase in catechol pathway